ncbi:MAG: hypothetical protein JO030_08825 [Candidatus Eremiobacteraeota bacterium]|nr:hypothetical protein [Candidatus Eremiobacteraeota bacterium]
MIFGLVFAAVLRADVLISAGHEGRPASCARFPQHRCNLGAAGERQWTPVVADAATQILRRHGVTVARLPADFSGQYAVKAAVFLHFDGANPACTSGASVGYARSSDMPAAVAWHALYWRYWPFAFQPDNFTPNLRGYYGFRQVAASKASLVLELGEITCPAQRRWLEPRLHWEGALLAHFLSTLMDKGSIADPGRFSEAQPQRP